MPVDARICCGCGTCAAVCPTGAITMEYDGEGFRYPNVDNRRCVACHRCESVCPAAEPPREGALPRALAAQNREEAQRRESSSGGVFTALALDTLKAGGIVCAAAYTDDFTVRHTLAETAEAVAAQRGAKYAQSEAEHCFPAIREALDAGRPVLFVGTPCQTAALAAFLGDNREKLLLVDMVCHGVPSPGVWRSYLQWRRQGDAGGANICYVNLRDKSTGWSRYRYSVRIRYENGREYTAPQGEDPFLRGFVGNLYLRPSCESCPFRDTRRRADLTLGDYWGIWEQNPAMDDDRGTSLVLLHTPRGEAAWERIAPGFRWAEAAYPQAVARNPSAREPSPPHAARQRFFRGLDGQKNPAAWIEKCLTVPRDGMLRRLWKKLGGSR